MSDRTTRIAAAFIALVGIDSLALQRHFMLIAMQAMADGFYPYAFRDAGVLGFGRVALNMAGLAMAFGVSGLVIVVPGRQLSLMRATA